MKQRAAVSVVTAVFASGVAGCVPPVFIDDLVSMGTAEDEPPTGSAAPVPRPSTPTSPPVRTGSEPDAADVVQAARQNVADVSSFTGHLEVNIGEYHCEYYLSKEMLSGDYHFVAQEQGWGLNEDLRVDGRVYYRGDAEFWAARVAYDPNSKPYAHTVGQWFPAEMAEGVLVPSDTSTVDITTYGDSFWGSFGNKVSEQEYDEGRVVVISGGEPGYMLFVDATDWTPVAVKLPAEDLYEDGVGEAVLHFTDWNTYGGPSTPKEGDVVDAHS